MSPPKKAKKPSAKKPTPAKMKAPARAGSDGSFLVAFAKLPRSRKVSVRKGLAAAPPEAYASQPASIVDDLANLPASELKRFAEQVGGYAARQAARAKSEWERSPLIAELKRRKL